MCQLKAKSIPKNNSPIVTRNGSSRNAKNLPVEPMYGNVNHDTNQDVKCEYISSFGQQYFQRSNRKTMNSKDSINLLKEIQKKDNGNLNEIKKVQTMKRTNLVQRRELTKVEKNALDYQKKVLQNRDKFDIDNKGGWKWDYGFGGFFYKWLKHGDLKVTYAFMKGKIFKHRQYFMENNRIRDIADAWQVQLDGSWKPIPVKYKIKVYKMTKKWKQERLRIKSEGILIEDMPYVWNKTVRNNPKLLHSFVGSRIREIDNIIIKQDDRASSFSELLNSYIKLRGSLGKIITNRKTPATIVRRFDYLEKKHENIKKRFTERNRQKIRDELSRSRREISDMKVQLIYAYRDAYMSGKNPEDIFINKVVPLSMITEKSKDLLVAINKADANLTGRRVSPIIPVLDKSLTLIKLFAGWKRLGLMSESQNTLRKLQNALNFVQAGLSLFGAGRLLPLFGHLSPMLDAIVVGWERIVGKMRKVNAYWWNNKDILGEKFPYGEIEIGGNEGFNYINKVFKLDRPVFNIPDKLFNVFSANYEMFDRIAQDLTETYRTPKEYGIFGENLNRKKLASWIYTNKETVWRVIYGRDKKRFPSEPSPDLPISWPRELPTPVDKLVRTGKGGKYWEGNERGPLQKELQNEIKENRKDGLPPPNPCFKDFAHQDPFNHFDAHHIQPIFLGGDDLESNLCALFWKWHETGHEKLRYQHEWEHEYEKQGLPIDLYKHKDYTSYYIAGKK